MVRMFVRHPVSDFAQWKQAYDDFDGERRDMGVVDHAAYHAPDDPTDVTVWHDFPSLEAARTFADSPRLKEVMQGAGVAGAPDIWFAVQA